jgi:hypothetical protein
MVIAFEANILLRRLKQLRDSPFVAFSIISSILFKVVLVVVGSIGCCR